MSDSLAQLPTNAQPVSSDDYARVQPYLAAPKPRGEPLRFYVFMTVLFVLLSLPFWNALGAPYVVLGIRAALFLAALVIWNWLQ